MGLEYNHEQFVEEILAQMVDDEIKAEGGFEATDL
jgi:hypothetical protein